MLHESRIRVEPCVRHVWFAKKREQQLATAAVDNQSHGNIYALPRRPNDRMIHHAKVVPRREANLRYASAGVGNPAILRLADVLAESKGPPVPIGGGGQEVKDGGERAIDANRDGPSLDRFWLARRIILGTCVNRVRSKKCGAQHSSSQGSDDPLRFQHPCDVTAPRQRLY